MMKPHLLLIAAVFLLVTGCEKKERLYIFNWTYYTPPTVIEKFSKEFNIEVIEDNFDANEIMYNKLIAGGADYDIIFPSSDYAEILIAQGMLQEIDLSKLPNLANIDPLVLIEADYDPMMRYAVPYYWGAAGITVNTAQVPEFERSWSIFESPELRNRVTMLDDPREVLGGALKYLGFSLNTTNLAEINAARDLVLTRWQQNIRRFDSLSFAKNYISGAFWVVQGYPEGIFIELDNNGTLLRDTVFFIPHEGSPSYIDSMCIPKGARNVDAAHKFINYIHRPEIYAEFCDTFRFPSTVNTAARPLLTTVPMYSINDIVSTELKKDVGAALSLYSAAWEEIRTRIGERN